MVQQPYQSTIRNLSRINPSVSSSSMGGQGFQGFSATLDSAFNLMAKESIGENKAQQARKYIEEQMQTLGNLVGVSNFTQEDLEKHIAYTSRQSQMLGHITAAENLATQNKIAEERVQIRVNAIANQLKGDGTIRRMSNPDINFASQFEAELQRGMLSLGGDQYGNVISHDSQGNPVTLNMEDLDTQELMLFAKSIFATKNAMEESARGLQSQRSLQSSVTRAQMNINKSVESLFRAELIKQGTEEHDMNVDASTAFRKGMFGTSETAEEKHPLTGKKIYFDEDNRPYTEKSGTFETDGMYVNIPTIDTNTGKPFASFEEALASAEEEQSAFWFNTEEEAIRAAKRRSELLSASLTPDWANQRDTAMNSLMESYQDLYDSGVENPQKVFLDSLSSSLQSNIMQSEIDSGSYAATIDLLNLMQQENFSLYSDDSGPIPFAPEGTSKYDDIETIKSNMQELWQGITDDFIASEEERKKAFEAFLWDAYRSLKDELGTEYFYDVKKQEAFMDDMVNIARNRFKISDINFAQLEKVWDKGKTENTDSSSPEFKKLQREIFSVLPTASLETIDEFQTDLIELDKNGLVSDADYRTLANEIGQRRTELNAETNTMAAEEEEAIKGFTKFSVPNVATGYARKYANLQADQNYSVDGELIEDIELLRMDLRKMIRDGGSFALDATQVNLLNTALQKAKTKGSDLQKAFEIIGKQIGKDLTMTIEGMLTTQTFQSGEMQLPGGPQIVETRGDMLLRMERNSIKAQRILRDFTEIATLLDIYGKTETVTISTEQREAVNAFSSAWKQINFD